MLLVIGLLALSSLAASCETGIRVKKGDLSLAPDSAYTYVVPDGQCRRSFSTHALCPRAPVLVDVTATDNGKSIDVAIDAALNDVVVTRTRDIIFNQCLGQAEVTVNIKCLPVIEPSELHPRPVPFPPMPMPFRPMPMPFPPMSMPFPPMPMPFPPMHMPFPPMHMPFPPMHMPFPPMHMPFPPMPMPTEFRPSPVAFPPMPMPTEFRPSPVAFPPMPMPTELRPSPVAFPPMPMPAEFRS